MKHKQQAMLENRISEVSNSLPESDQRKSSLILETLTKRYPQYARLPRNMLNTKISQFLSPNESQVATEETSNNTKTHPSEKPPSLKRKAAPSSLETEMKSALLERQRTLESCPSLDQLGGLSNILPQVLQLIYLPLKYKHLFTTLNLSPPRGILLTGPPGSGKTALAMAIGKHIKETLGFTFLFNSGTELIAGVSGESEQNIRGLFQEAANSSPALIFIDEIDTLLSKSRRFNSEHSSSRATIN